MTVARPTLFGLGRLLWVRWYYSQERWFRGRGRCLCLGCGPRLATSRDWSCRFFPSLAVGTGYRCRFSETGCGRAGLPFASMVDDGGGQREWEWWKWRWLAAVRPILAFRAPGYWGSRSGRSDWRDHRPNRKQGCSKKLASEHRRRRRSVERHSAGMWMLEAVAGEDRADGVCCGKMRVR